LDIRVRPDNCTIGISCRRVDMVAEEIHRTKMRALRESILSRNRRAIYSNRGFAFLLGRMAPRGPATPHVRIVVTGVR
jgi:hypothetical protein